MAVFLQGKLVLFHLESSCVFNLVSVLLFSVLIFVLTPQHGDYLLVTAYLLPGLSSFSLLIVESAH